MACTWRGAHEGANRCKRQIRQQERYKEEGQPASASVCTCQSETFCLSSLLRTRPHSLAPVLLCLVSTGVCGCPDKFCWFWSTQQCCSSRSHTEFKFTSDTRIAVMPEACEFLRVVPPTRDGGWGGVKGSPPNLRTIAGPAAEKRLREFTGRKKNAYIQPLAFRYLRQKMKSKDR